MGFLSVIRRWALRDKMPIREIARRTGLSRNTIKKYLRAGIVEPRFQTPARPSKLDPYAEKLSGWLVTEQRKSRKDRRTAKQMHADLVQLGYDGSYEGSQPLCGPGKETGSARSKRRIAGHSCRWCSSQARRSSSTGARTGCAWAARR